MELEYKRFIIGLIITVSGFGAANLLNNSLSDTTLLAVVGVTSVLGVALMVTSGFEGRLILGAVITFGVVALFAMVHNFDAQSTQVLTVAAVFGVILMATALPSAVNLDQLRSLLRGGYRGTVKNLRQEGGLLSFWLEGAARDGSAIQVEGNIAEGAVGEGDAVWVRGSPDGRGVIRTKVVENLSRSSEQKLSDRRGDAEFTGVVVGGIYDLKIRENLLGAKEAELLGFRVQRTDADGNPVDTIEVEIKGDKYRGIAFDRDKVKVKGRWQSSGRLRLSEIENLTTKNKTKV